MRYKRFHKFQCFSKELNKRVSFAVLYYKVRSVWFISLMFYIVRPYKKLSKVMYFPLLVLPSVSSVNI
jgi:hypothetical protein